MKSLYILLVIILQLTISIHAQDCNALFDKVVDRFDDKVTYRSLGRDYWESGTAGLTKIVNPDGTEHSWLRLNVMGLTYNPRQTDVIILFANGTKMIRRDVDIDVDINSGSRGYWYTAYVYLNIPDIVMLTESPITEFRLYIHEGSVGRQIAKRIQQGAKCLTALKGQ